MFKQDESFVLGVSLLLKAFNQNRSSSAQYWNHKKQPVEDRRFQQSVESVESENPSTKTKWSTDFF